MFPPMFVLFCCCVSDDIPRHSKNTIYKNIVERIGKIVFEEQANKIKKHAEQVQLNLESRLSHSRRWRLLLLILKLVKVKFKVRIVESIVLTSATPSITTTTASTRWIINEIVVKTERSICLGISGGPRCCCCLVHAYSRAAVVMMIRGRGGSRRL